ncbi:MAG: homoserine dehydrogenase [Methanomicrobiales archaeon]|nr:homoserine dehydrogenase [Methanomicrobiales archaeon]MDI6877348.1 homoserine dehydrogenase [Methanomicrobiales archaeon]
MKIAILGFGSVGQGVASVIAQKSLGLTVTGIADSKSGVIDNAGISLAEALERKRTTGRCGSPGISAMDVIRMADYDALVEVTPTNAQTGEPALSHIRAALECGRHVVTSNKGPIALAFQDLQSRAARKGVQLRYEATVCGAVPIFHLLEHGLSGNRIIAIHGVLNGTCNYILSRMDAEGLTYDQALVEARELGYAEADPTYDVRGIDTAIKLVILANAIWRLNAHLSDVEVTGIDNLTPEALRLADEQGMTIRLIGEAIPEKGLLRVSPRIIEWDHPLVVHGTLNAVTIETDLAGPLTIVGKGAGSIETASAVIGDLLFIRDCYVKGA